MQNAITTPLIIFLIILIILYVYDIFINPQGENSTIETFQSLVKKHIPNTLKTQNIIEKFSQYSSLIPNTLSSQTTAQFDTNWYLRDPNKPIILNNKIALPVIRYGFYSPGSYDNLIGNYFRRHIYPIEQLQIDTGLNAIYKFINNDTDIAFINEELLTRFIKKDCKYLTQLIIENLGLDNILINDASMIERIYPPINFSAIGVGYYQDFYLIVNNYSNIMQFEDIAIKAIGVLEDSYYYFIKLCSAYMLDITKMNIIRNVNMKELLYNMEINKYDGLFAVLHPKNKQLVALTKKMKLRYIHIQKRQGGDIRKNLETLIPDAQGTNNKAPPPPPDINRQQIYSKSLMEDLQTENIKATFNDLIRKYFQKIMPRTVDLNKFHKSGNLYSYLETYSTRMILVVRDDIPEERVKYITRNYINHLNKMRDSIDRQEFIPQLNNLSSREFNYDELASFDKHIPLASGARDVYINEGLIYYKDFRECKL